MLKLANSGSGALLHKLAVISKRNGSMANWPLHLGFLQSLSNVISGCPFPVFRQCLLRSDGYTTSTGGTNFEHSGLDLQCLDACVELIQLLLLGFGWSYNKVQAVVKAKRLPAWWRVKVMGLPPVHPRNPWVLCLGYRVITLSRSTEALWEVTTLMLTPES